MKKTINTLLIALMICTLSFGQSIEKFSIDSGGASASAGGIQILYTIGEVNVAERTSTSLSLSEGFINSNLKIKISPLVFLQGPILLPVTPGLMNDILREDSLIPTTSPYSDNVSVIGTPFTTTGNNAIVDWVWVELRSANDNTKLINGKSALLQRDGDIVGLDGTSDLIMQAGPTDYYVVIKHRNHLAVMSNNPIVLNENTTTVVDFTSNGFATFGTNAQAILGTGETAMWTGDTNISGVSKFSGSGSSVGAIKDYVLADPGNGFGSVTYNATGYLIQDIDLNGVAKFSGAGSDTAIIKDNVLAHPGNGFGSVTYTINGTVPEN